MLMLIVVLLVCMLLVMVLLVFFLLLYLLLLLWWLLLRSNFLFFFFFLLYHIMIFLNILSFNLYKFHEFLFQINQLLLLLLLFLLLQWVILLDRFLQLCLFLSDLQCLLPLCLPIKYTQHDFLLLWLQCIIIQRPAQWHHTHCTFSITNSSHWLHDWDSREGTVWDFLRVGDLVLAVEEVPDVDETVHAGEEEETSTGGRPTTVG